MGQYYKTVNLTKHECLEPHDCDNSIKLTESCFVKNTYVDAITQLLMGRWHGDDVVVCGDYAWNEDGTFSGSAADKLASLTDVDPYTNPGRDIAAESLSVVGHSDWYSDDDGNKAPIYGADAHHRFLVDETTREYVDRAACPIEWAAFVEIRDDGMGAGVRTSRYDPLTFWLAAGNGLGGGDLRGDDTMLAQVGSRIGHAITAVDSDEGLRGSGFVEIASPFYEGERIEASDEDMLRAMRKFAIDNRSLLMVASETSRNYMVIEQEQLAELLKA